MTFIGKNYIHLVAYSFLFAVMLSCGTGDGKNRDIPDASIVTDECPLQIDYTLGRCFRLTLDGNRLSIKTEDQSRDGFGPHLPGTRIVYKVVELNAQEIDSLRILVSQIDDGNIHPDFLVLDADMNTLTINNELVHFCYGRALFDWGSRRPSIHRLLLYMIELLDIDPNKIRIPLSQC